jgi:hypothetical protein
MQEYECQSPSSSPELSTAPAAAEPAAPQPAQDGDQAARHDGQAHDGHAQPGANGQHDAPPPADPDAAEPHARDGPAGPDDAADSELAAIEPGEVELATSAAAGAVEPAAQVEPAELAADEPGAIEPATQSAGEGEAREGADALAPDADGLALAPDGPPPAAPLGDPSPNGAVMEPVGPRVLPKAFDEDTLRAYLALMLHESPGCLEIRAWHAQFQRNREIHKSDYQTVIGGWFNDINFAVSEILRFREVSLYCTVNPCDPRLLSRAEGLHVIQRGGGTSDVDILHYRGVYIDCDSKRPEGIPATDAELALALALRDNILGGEPGFRESSFWGGSGNGGYIYLRLPDLPNNHDTYNALDRLLKRLGEKYNITADDGRAAIVDQRTKNSSRVMCLPGTLKCKGIHKAERPWRPVTIDSQADRPIDWHPVPFDLFGWLAAQPEPEPPKAPAVAVAVPLAAGAAANTQLIQRAREYVTAMAPSISGQHGHDQCFDASCALVLGFGLSLHDALPILQAFNARCTPPWSDSELLHKLADADAKGGRRGYLAEAKSKERQEGRDFITRMLQGEIETDVQVPTIDAAALAAHAADWAADKDFCVEALYRNSDFLTRLAWLEQSNLGEAIAVMATLERIRGLKARTFKAVLDPYRALARQAIAAAQKQEQATQAAEEERPREADDDPHRLARTVIEGYTEPGCLPKIVAYRDDFYLFTGRYYRRFEDFVRVILVNLVKRELDEVAADALRVWNARPPEAQTGKPPEVRKVTRPLVADVVQALAALVHVDRAKPAPHWRIQAEGLPDPRDLIPMANGLLNIATDPPTLLSHSADLFGTTLLPYSYDVNAPTPERWLKLLKNQWDDDRESIDTLHEIFGYLLTSDTSHQKIFMLIGPPRSGRSTIKDVLVSLIGSANVGSTSPAGLASDFGLEPLLHKTVGIMGDARAGDSHDQALMVDRLLRII